jgi:hypothetical protein
MIEQCNHPLSRGRSCCHVKGHAGRHSHTWQQGDARYLDIDDKIIDMETGEVVGYSGDLGHRIIDTLASERKEPAPDEKQAKARRVLERQYGARIPENYGPVYAVPPDGYDWHYEGTYRAYGTDSIGHSVEFDFRTGKVQRIYSQNQRKEVVSYARASTAAKASRKFGIPAGTIRSWMKRSE